MSSINRKIKGKTSYLIKLFAEFNCVCPEQHGLDKRDVLGFLCPLMSYLAEKHLEYQAFVDMKLGSA